MCGWGAVPAYKVVPAAELVVTGKCRSRFFFFFFKQSVYSCITPLMKTVLIVITVVQPCITLSAGTIVVQILIQADQYTAEKLCERNCISIDHQTEELQSN